MGRWYKGEVRLSNDRLWVLTSNLKYWVSEYGDVVNAESGYVLKPTLSESGYLVVGKQITGDVGLHRVVYTAFLGEIPDGLQINHIDGNKANNHLSNLEVCTPSENTKHAYDNKLAKGKDGQTNSQAKVTEDDVIMLYSLIKCGLTNDDIAEKLGLHPRYISLVRHGRRWKKLFNREGMIKIKSVGSLPYPIPTCVHIYNTCILSDKSQDVLAEELEIDASTVSRIRTGKTWKSLRKFFNLPENTLNWKTRREELEVSYD